MVKRSKHRLKGTILKLRRGLAVYQTHASPFYFARILDPRTQRYKVRSTKETSRVEARKVAEDYAQEITRRDAPADKEFSFRTYAKRFTQQGQQSHFVWVKIPRAAHVRGMAGLAPTADD